MSYMEWDILSGTGVTTALKKYLWEATDQSENPSIHWRYSAEIWFEGVKLTLSIQSMMIIDEKCLVIKQLEMSQWKPYGRWKYIEISILDTQKQNFDVIHAKKKTWQEYYSWTILVLESSRRASQNLSLKFLRMSVRASWLQGWITTPSQSWPTATVGFFFIFLDVICIASIPADTQTRTKGQGSNSTRCFVARF